MKRPHVTQQVLIFLYTSLGLATLWLNPALEQRAVIERVFIYYAVYLVLMFVATNYRLKGKGKLLMNMCLLLLSTSIILLGRLTTDMVQLQVKWIIVSSIVLLISMPLYDLMIKWESLNYIYAIFGLGVLILPFFFGEQIRGATNWVTINGFSFQPSEFIKLVLIVFLASLYRGAKSFKTFIIGSLISGVYVLILVAQNDLGGALIYTMIYLFMTYIYTERDLFLLGGLGGITLCAFLSFKLFGHVQLRVEAWLDPWRYIETSGYQIAQALFGISEGGWFGTGLLQGMPEKIPIVTSDFIFAALCEEMGVLMGIMVIGVYMTILYLITKAVSKEKRYESLLVYGTSVALMFQMFLIIGGVIKMLPLSGVTLPFVSYGGSSLLVSMLMIGLVQCMYLKGDKNEKRRDKRQTKKKKANIQE